MKHLVNITAWRRPEFFLATLRRMALADRTDVAYRIRIDHNHHPAVLEMAKDFADQLIGNRVEIFLSEPYDQVTNGLPFLPDNNMLSVMHESLAYEAEYYHFTEDDVVVNRNYFDYHESGHALDPDAFSVSAYSPDLQHVVTDENVKLARRTVHTLTVASSFRRPVLEEVARYLPLSYLKDPIGHLGRTFPHSNPHDYWGIDGALSRTRHVTGRLCMVPLIGRAYHIGYIGSRCWPTCDIPVKPGYPHRHGPVLPGTLEEQADTLLSMTVDDYNKIAEMADHVVYDLDQSYGPVTQLLS